MPDLLKCIWDGLQVSTTLVPWIITHFNLSVTYECLLHLVRKCKCKIKLGRNGLPTKISSFRKIRHIPLLTRELKHFLNKTHNLRLCKGVRDILESVAFIALKIEDSFLTSGRGRTMYGWDTKLTNTLTSGLPEGDSAQPGIADRTLLWYSLLISSFSCWSVAFPPMSSWSPVGQLLRMQQLRG